MKAELAAMAAEEQRARVLQCAASLERADLERHVAQSQTLAKVLPVNMDTYAGMRISIGTRVYVLLDIHMNMYVIHHTQRGLATMRGTCLFVSMRVDVHTDTRARTRRSCPAR